MKREELRIGNWVLSNDLNGKPIDYQIKRGYEIDEADRQYEPILLTEEWLLKFGFHEKYKSVSNRWYLRASTLNAGCEIIDPEDEETGKLTGNFYYRNSDGAIDAKYVHQLQNLYFALTGEELTIKK